MNRRIKETAIISTAIIVGTIALIGATMGLMVLITPLFTVLNVVIAATVVYSAIVIWGVWTVVSSEKGK